MQKTGEGIRNSDHGSEPKDLDRAVFCFDSWISEFSYRVSNHFERMVNSMVERATSSMLIGPDWSMNTEICDICNHDPAQAKDVVKGIKKRFGSKNPKVQLLALTLLETIMKNCGDFVHMHVAERDLLHEMVKIVKKKPDFHVKEKILILIDTWQESFGGARARYPQYYAAYHELLRLGAVFPQKSDRPAPAPQTQTQTQTQTQSRSSSSFPENGNETATAAAEAEFPSLSLTELQNARGIMDVLAEMLTAIDPQNKEGLRQEVIVDLVEQCRTYKQRVVHLVNSTSDESLLCQGLALNDDLQRVLAKHESLVSGTFVASKPETSKALVPVDFPLIDTGDTKQPPSATAAAAGSSSDNAELLAITTSEVKVNPKFDLLSGDDFMSPTSENSLAIVPMGELESSTPVSQHNALALVDMLSLNNMPAGQTYSSPPQFQQPQNLYPNGNSNIPNTLPIEPQTPFTQQQQDPPLPAASYGGSTPTSDGLPPPPWEAQSTDDNHSQSQSQPQPNNDDQGMNMYMQPHHQPLNNQTVYPQMMSGMGMGMGMISQHHMYQQMYPNQMQQPQQPYAYGYGYGNGNGNGNGNGYGYGYGQQLQQQQQQQPNGGQFIDQRMSGLSLNTYSTSNTVYTGPSMANASYVHVPSGKPTNPQDKLFGDLLDFSKVKANKS